MQSGKNHSITMSTYHTYLLHSSHISLLKNIAKYITQIYYFLKCCMLITQGKTDRTIPLRLCVSIIPHGKNYITVIFMLKFELSYSSKFLILIFKYLIDSKNVLLSVWSPWQPHLNKIVITTIINRTFTWLSKYTLSLIYQTAFTNMTFSFQ